MENGSTLIKLYLIWNSRGHRNKSVLSKWGWNSDLKWQRLASRLWHWYPAIAIRSPKSPIQSHIIEFAGSVCMARCTKTYKPVVHSWSGFGTHHQPLMVRTFSIPQFHYLKRGRAVWARDSRLWQFPNGFNDRHNWNCDKRRHFTHTEEPSMNHSHSVATRTYSISCINKVRIVLYP